MTSEPTSPSELALLTYWGRLSLNRGALLTCDVSPKAKEHAKKVAKELGARDGLIYLLGQESQRYEDSDMAPEFRQRR